MRMDECDVAMLQVEADKVFFWHDGSTMPSFQFPLTEEEKNNEGERPESDADVVRKDVVKVSR